MTPEDGLTETASEPFSLLLPDGLAPVAVEVGDTTPPGTYVEMRTREVIKSVDLDAL